VHVRVDVEDLVRGGSEVEGRERSGREELDHKAAKQGEGAARSREEREGEGAKGGEGAAEQQQRRQGGGGKGKVEGRRREERGEEGGRGKWESKRGRGGGGRNQSSCAAFFFFLPPDWPDGRRLGWTALCCLSRQAPRACSTQKKRRLCGLALLMLC